MTPFYQDDLVTLYCGDAREVLPYLDPVDLVIADPPYGDTSLEWDRRPFIAGWLQSVRVTRAASVWCFGSLRMFFEHAAAFDGWRIAQDVVWEKQNGSSSAADRFRRVHEHVVQFYPVDVTWSDVYKAPVTTADATRRTVRRKARPPHWGSIGEGRYASVDGGPRLARSVLRVTNCHGYAEHPTQKPIGIVAPLLAYSCPPGGTVLDPTCGSGTTLVAARDGGWRSIGIEINPRDCETVVRRLSQQVLPIARVT